MARTKQTYRVETHLNRAYTEDAEVIEWLESVPNKSAAIRGVLIDHVKGSRYARLEMRNQQLEHELELMRKVIARLTGE